MPKQEEIVEIYKGVAIRKSNQVKFRLNAWKFRELIDLVEQTDFSIPKIISISNQPCEPCKGGYIIVSGKDGKEVKIKRGLLSDYTLMNSGTNIIQQKKRQ